MTVQQAIINILEKYNQLTNDHVIRNIPEYSASNIQTNLKQMILDGTLYKSRVGRYVFYALSTSKKEVNPIIMDVLEQNNLITIKELSTRTGLTLSVLAEQLQYLLHKEEVYKFYKPGSEVYYSLREDNPGYYTQMDEYIAPIKQPVGPYLREFLFNIPIVGHVYG
jgi:hypothetical protein